MPPTFPDRRSNPEATSDPLFPPTFPDFPITTEATPLPYFTPDPESPEQQLPDFCREERVTQLARCACCHANRADKWATGAKQLCSTTFRAPLSSLWSSCTPWLTAVRTTALPWTLTADTREVSLADLDTALLRTALECTSDVFVTARPAINTLQTTQPFFFAPLIAIVVKQAALAAARAAMRAAAAALRRAAIARARASSLRKAAQSAAKKAREKARREAERVQQLAKKAREEVRRRGKEFCKFKKKFAKKKLAEVAECVCDQFTTGKVPLDEEELAVLLLDCVNPEVPEVCVANVGRRFKEGELVVFDMLLELQDCM